MRIDQLVAGFTKHDAITNHAIEVRRVLRTAGYESDIYADHIDPRSASSGPLPFADCLQASSRDRLFMYHASTSSRIAAWLAGAAAAGETISLDYHNITPAAYFARWEPVAASNLRKGRMELASLSGLAAFGLADSSYNETELRELGLRSTAVCPVLIDLERYHRAPVRRTAPRLRRLDRDGGRRWLFVGRIAPNKCQHDVLAAFAIYRRVFDPRARLTLLGTAESPTYLRAITRLIADLDLGASVEMRPSASFAQLLDSYHAADLFVCLSEHEGFCVPVVEAMELGVPVIAFRAAAVTETVGGGGLLLASKDPLVVACAADDVLTNETKRSALVEAGRARAADFSLDLTSKRLLDALDGWLTASRS